MLSRLLLITLVLSAIFLFEGCATHAPVSENLMFYNKVTNPNHESSNEYGFVSTYSPTKSPAVTFAENEHSERGPDYDYERFTYNRYGLSGGAYLVNYDGEGRFAFSGTVGVLVTGADATVKLWGRNYFTAAISTPMHTQLYLQHRTFNNSKFGAALGIGYQSTAYSFDSQDGFISIERKNLNSFGARGFVIFRDNANINSPARRFGVYVGYAPLIKRPIVQVSLMNGRF